MKKILTVFLCLLMSFCLFAQAASETENSEEIVLNVWGGIPAENGPQQICDNFSASHPGVTVKYNYYMNDDAGNVKLDTALLSNNGVDMFYSHGPDRFLTRMNSGLCMDITDKLKESGLDVAKEFGTVASYVDGKYYGIPVTQSADFVWVNLDMLAEEGITIPENWTMEDYRAIAKALVKEDGDSKRWGTMTHYNWNNSWMKPAFIACGDVVSSDKYGYNLDNEYFERALQLRYDMEVTDGSMIPTALAKTSNLSIQNMFLTEKVGMAWAGSWIIRYAKDIENFPHDFKIGFVPIPRWSDSDNYYNSNAALDEFLAVNPNSKHKDLAYELLEYWATEGYYPMSKGGKIPSWRGADPDKVVSYLLDEKSMDLFDLDSFKSILFGSYNWFSLPNVESHSELVAAFNIEAEKCLGGDQTAAEAIEAMKKVAESII